MKKNLNSPIILRQGSYSKNDVRKLQKEYKAWAINDVYKSQLEELFEIQNPGILNSNDYSKKLEKFVLSRNGENQGNWIYFPWDGNLIHTLNEEDYFLLRTNRNKQIINSKEQEKLNNSCVGFVGLSIGSHYAISMAHGGMANSMRLAEFDSISTSNLNRIRAGLKNVGIPKIEYVTKQIYEINPYADLKLFPKGLDSQSLEDFFKGDKKLDLIFEAIDDFEMKIRIRLEARKQKIPVIMLTNLGDSLLVDVERYDTDPNQELFNGLIGDTPEEILNSEIDEKKKVEYAIKIVGKEHLSGRILESLAQINKTLVGRPQIFSTVSTAGGFAVYLAKKLILSELKSGRYYFSFDKMMEVGTVA